MALGEVASVKNLPRLRSETFPRWRALVAELLARNDLLTQGFLDQIGTVEGYAGGAVPAEELRRMAVDSYQQLLLELLEVPLPDHLVGLAERLGRRRARQGVPIDDLAAAIRLDFGVLWSSLLWLAAEQDMPVLTAHVDRLWRVVDDYATRARVAYLEERAVLAREASNVQHALLVQLFASEGKQSLVVAQAATALALDPEAPLWVLAAGPGHAPALGQGLDGAEGVFRHDREGVLIAFGVEGPGTEAFLTTVATPCGLVRRVSGLAAVPAAAREAVVVDGLLAEGRRGPVGFGQVWARFAARSVAGSFPGFLDGVLAGLADVPDQERERLLGTARRFLATGSVAGTAAAEFCHRNTVKNRLRRFRELTGIDLEVPEQAALAVVALAGE